MFKQFLNKFPLNYYFCIGGIGDLFLAISSFYSYYYNTSNKIGLVFWANNEKIIRQILSYFPNIKPIITQNYLSTLNAMNYYEDIVNSNKFIGKAHIPDKLQYVQEWSKVNDVFDEYKIQRYNDFYKEIFKDENGSYSNKIVIQPQSLSIEQYKTKRIKNEYIDDIISSNYKSDIIITGSPNDLEAYKSYDVKLCYDMLETIKYTVNAREVHSCDSWSKTLSGLCGINTYYYVNEKVGDYTKIFGVDYDPSDNIFLKNWDFNIVNQFNYDVSHLGKNNNYM